MKKILSLVLTIVMLFTVASCNLTPSTGFQENSTESTTPEVTTPTVTTPEATTPEVTTPTVTTPEATTPEGSTPEVTTPEGSTPEVTTPEVTTPATEKPTIPEFEVSLPEVSKVIANIIGVVAATVEVSKDAQFVVVIEEDDEFSESNGSKQVLFFEVAEAVLDSDGELLNARLTAKIGEAVVNIPENGSAQDVVVGKENIESYYEISVVVNGDNVSVSFNDQNASVNLSDLVYGEIAKMMGMQDVEALKAMLAEAQKNAYIAQELGKNVAPMIAAALNGALQELPTVSPAYVEHLAELFAAIGQDIVTVTTDNVSGNTTYSLNIAALKSLLAEIEGKTFAQYLESVYGENVVGSLSSFLKTLPDKKVKDIVDAAVALAETTGVEIKDIYALIDMYIYSVAGVEFNIEEQINTRYNNTLVELLVEFNGIQPEEKAEFIQGIKDSFANAANVIETVSIDAFLSSMFMGTEEGFIEALKASIDMLDEQIVYNYTFDAEGIVVEINYGIGGFQYNLTVDGENSIITVSTPVGVELVITTNGTNVEVVVKQDGEQIASGKVIVTEEIIDEDIFVTVDVDLRDAENDLLDCQIMSANGVITMLNVDVRGYDIWYEVIYNAETDEYEEIRHEDFVEIFSVEYNDFGEIGKVFTFTSGVNVIRIVKMGDELVVDITSDGELIASGSISKTEEFIGEDVVTTVVIDFCNSEDDLLDYTAVSTNGIVTSLNIVFRGYNIEETFHYYPETGEFTETYEKEIVDVFNVNYTNVIDEFGNDIETTLNATINFKQSTAMGHKNDETGEYSESREEKYYEFAAIAYSELADGNIALNILLGEIYGIQISQDINNLNVTITEEGEFVAGGSVSITNETIGEDAVSTVVIDIRDGEKDLLDYTVVSVNGVTTEFNVVVRGTYVEEEWVEVPMTEEELNKYYEDLFGFGGGAVGGDYIVVAPENGFVTINPSPDGSANDDYYVDSDIVIEMKPAVKMELVRTETFVDWFSVEYTDNGDETVLKFGAHESIMSGADYITITTSQDQISAVLTQDGEVIADAALAVIENGVKITISDNAVFEITNPAEGEIVIGINLSDLCMYDYGYASCYIAFNGDIVIKVA